MRQNILILILESKLFKSWNYDFLFTFQAYYCIHIVKFY